MNKKIIHPPLHLPSSPLTRLSVYPFTCSPVHLFTCLLFYLLTFSPIASLQGQDTFSIVAADSATREVGSAGASCVDLFSAGYSDATFLGDLLPDTGAINTQASYLTTNQNNARAQMRAGSTPAQIIDWLITHDATNNPHIRQYGIVGFNGDSVSAAGYTGMNCINYKNHLTGSINGIWYSIQGNILLGQLVLDSMEARFRNAPGDVACRLMAALQGAKMVGADTRCTSNGTSSLFAFVKVSQPTDPYGSPSLKVSVKTRANAHIEPIDSLQILFDEVHDCITTGAGTGQKAGLIKIYPNPSFDQISISLPSSLNNSSFLIADMLGNTMITGNIRHGENSFSIAQLPAGMYVFKMNTGVVMKLVKAR
jgi:uncharacterized Ntn-hydrolase superfamily protein